MKTMEPCNKLNAKMSSMKKEDEEAYFSESRLFANMCGQFGQIFAQKYKIE